MIESTGVDVLVFGSANVDLHLAVPHLPEPGETVLAGDSSIGVGGKGVNQAVAGARAGARTAFHGAVGADSDGAAVRAALAGAAVGTAGLRTVDAPTGRAVISVDAGGHNTIVVLPGANDTLTELTSADRDAITTATFLLLQLEIPAAGVLAAATFAHSVGARVILNAAPVQTLPAGLWALVDLLVVNQSEAVALAGPGAEPGDLAARLLDRVPAVLITLGEHGSLYQARDEATLTIPAMRVRAVDTTAAGDTYCGVLAAGLAAGHDLPRVLYRASAAAGLSVQRRGAIDSIPDAADIEDLTANGPHS